MDIASAQREMRQAFLGGAVGQTVAALVWLGGGLIALSHGPCAAMWSVALAGMFIFPVTQAALRLVGERGDAPGNPLMSLGWQVAIPAALLLPLVFAATAYRETWFFPALLVAIGAHYLPFAFLYGMRLFIWQAFAMVSAGLLIGRFAAHDFTLGAWVGVGLLVAGAVSGWRVAMRERAVRGAA